MTRQILVPVSGSDRVEQFIPYLEEVAQRGTKIIFLVNCRLNRWREFIDDLRIFHTGYGLVHSAQRSVDLAGNWSRAAEDGLHGACKVLTDRGIEIRIHVYAGPLRKILKEYVRKENVHLVMMRPRPFNWIAVHLRKIGSHTRILNATTPPVLLVHPHQVVER